MGGRPAVIADHLHRQGKRGVTGYRSGMGGFPTGSLEADLRDAKSRKSMG
jgi:hypothetical protein